MKRAEPAPESSPPPRPILGVIRFGSFEVDVHAGELRRGGLKLKLGGQPFAVLLALLENPGQVVTREELHDKLWSRDTFVDFEQGLNKAINKLRETLGDEADNPHFIETLPRKGYRFLAPVTAPVQAEAPVAGQADASVKTHPAVQTRRRLGMLTIPVILVAAAIVIVASKPARTPRVLHYTQLTNDGLKKSARADSALATDGSRVYFWEQDGQQSFIAQVSVMGGNVSTVAKFPNVRSAVLDYSRSRSELLFSPDYQSPLWALQVPEGSARRRVGDFVVDDASWSPDGESIALGNANKLLVVKADGSQPKLLATLPDLVDVVCPRWSPDGRLLRFSAILTDQRDSIWEVRADGTDLHPVFSTWKTRNDYGGSWTPDGRYFVYNSLLPNAHGSIFSIRNVNGPLDGSKGVELTPGPMSFSAPVMSMDGKKIFAVGSLNQGELVRYDSKTKVWTPYLSGISAADVDFSRNGEWITYVLIPEGTLWRSRVNGGERLQLTFPPMRTSLPRWSPNGKQVVFAGLRPGGSWTIYLVAADGGQPRRLVSERTLYQDPNWSPDGKQVIFGESAIRPNAVHIVDVQTGQVSDLPGSGGLFSPRWSPDGHFVIAVSGVNDSPPGPQKLMRFDFNARKWTAWSEAPTSGFNYPSFSQDGKYVYFSDTDAATFYRVRIGSNKPEAIAKIDAPAA